IFLLMSLYVFYFSLTTSIFIYTLSLHDALPIFIANELVLLITKSRHMYIVSQVRAQKPEFCERAFATAQTQRATKTSHSQSSIRSEEHTSELQSRFDLVCRLLLEKKKLNH